MISDPSPGRRAWLVVVLLWFVAFSNFLARLLPTTMHGSLVTAIPMTEAQYGLLTSSLFLGYGLINPVGGFLGDRFSRSWVIIGSMAIWSVITWLTSYTRTFEQLVILRFFTGLSEGCYLPCALALISDYHTGPTRSLATGIHQSGYAIGMGLSGMGGWLAEKTSWHYAFSVVGLASLGYCGVLAFLLRDAPRESPVGRAPGEAESKVRVGDALVSLFSNRSFILYFVASSLVGTILWTVVSWMPVYLQEHFHLTQGTAGLTATGYMNAASVPGLLIGGSWADRWRRTNARAYMFVPAIGIVVASLGILLIANVDLLILAILGLIIYRLFLSFIDANGMPMLCEIIDSRYRGTAAGLATLVSAFGAGLGIYFSGVFRDSKIDLHLVFDVVAAASVVCAAMIYCVKRGPRDPRGAGGRA